MGGEIVFCNPPYNKLKLWAQKCYEEFQQGATVVMLVPDVKDTNRMLRGDYFSKPTGYWFFNCSPTHGFTEQCDKKRKKVHDLRSGAEAGLCSEERSMISPDYARNFICDFILGKEQVGSQLDLFNNE